LSGDQSVTQFGCAGGDFMSTVGVAAYLGKSYSFAVLDQIRDLDNHSLRGLTADPGLVWDLPLSVRGKRGGLSGLMIRNSASSA
jgi:hypothetical protein